ncbi:MAG: Trm112 family protein [Holophagae bacterium]|nr:Trm112 family protein [Holophagae bacterium]
MKFNEKLLEIIVCPECKAELKLTPDSTGLKCSQCKRVYPIDENGIPHLLLEEATVEE